MIRHSSITPKFASELDRGQQIKNFSDQEITALNQLAAERGVIVARDQDMDMNEQAAFAHRLGTPLESPVNKEDIPPKLLVIKANENSKKVAGQGWHSDVSSAAEPPGLSMLRMEVVPESGGDTLFANMCEAFETLSTEMQNFLKGLHARHDPRGHYLYLSGAKKLEELPSTIHPVVRTHPLTGKQSLYVNNGFVGKIVELSEPESSALLKMLYDHVAYSVNIQCRVNWEPNTVVFWDNRIVQHYAAFDYAGSARKGYRVTIKGEAPTL